MIALLSSLVLVCCVHLSASVEHEPPYVPFSPAELGALEEAVLHGLNLKTFLKERLDNVKIQITEFLVKVASAETDTAAFFAANSAQDSAIEGFKDEIKEVLTRLGSMESSLSDSTAITTGVKAGAITNAGIIGGLVQDNDVIAADLDELDTLLDQNSVKLNDTLESLKSETSNDIAAIADGIEDFTEVIDSKKCHVGTVDVPIDSFTGQGETTLVFNTTQLNGLTPDVTCGLISINSTLNNMKKNSGSAHGYIYVEERETTGFTIDCKAVSETNVEVLAFDHSRGTGNQVISVGVQVTACSFGSLGGW